MGTYAANVSRSEAGLAVRLKAREEEAFEELYQHFGRRILGACRRILKEEESARDALQEGNRFEDLLDAQSFSGRFSALDLD